MRYLYPLLTLLMGGCWSGPPRCPAQRDFSDDPFGQGPGVLRDTYPCCQSYLMSRSWHLCLDWTCEFHGKCDDGWNDPDGRNYRNIDGGMDPEYACLEQPDSAFNLCVNTTESTSTSTPVERAFNSAVTTVCRRGSRTGSTSVTLRYNNFAWGPAFVHAGEYIPQGVIMEQTSPTSFSINAFMAKKVTGVINGVPTYDFSLWYCDLANAKAYYAAHPELHDD